MLCAKVPSRMVATNDYHGGRNCAHDGLVDGEVEKKWKRCCQAQVASLWLIVEPKSPPAVMYPRNEKFVDDHQQEEKEGEYVHVVSEEEVVDPICQELKCGLGRVLSLQRLLE